MTQTVLITGASSGIGKALAFEYARHGASLALLARRESLLKEIAEQCQKLGSPKALVYAGDVTDQNFLENSVKAFCAKVAHLDLVIANAGVGYPGVFVKQDWQKIQNTFDVNVFAPLKLLRVAHPYLKMAGKGHFTVVSSLGAYRGAAFSASYNSSKAAVSAYFEGLRAELKTDNIAVSIVCPGFVKTPMTARNHFRMPFLLTAEKAAKRIRRGICKRKTYIIFPKRLAFLVSLVRLLPDHFYDRMSLKMNPRTYYE